MWPPAIGWQAVRGLFECKIDAAQSRPRADTESLIYRLKFWSEWALEQRFVNIERCKNTARVLAVTDDPRKWVPSSA